MSRLLKNYIYVVSIFFLMNIVPFVVWCSYDFTFQQIKRFIQSVPFGVLILIPLFVIRNNLIRNMYFYVTLFIGLIFSFFRSIYIYIYHVSPVEDSIVALLDTNINEVYSFLDSYLSFGVCIIAFLYVFIFFACKKIYFKMDCYGFTFHIVLFMLIILFPNISVKAIGFNVLGGQVYQYYYPYQVFSMIRNVVIKKREIEHMMSINYKDIHFSDNEILGIIVIGESASKRHQSMYGYMRKTNILCSRYINNILLFDNFYSAAPFTAESHKKMLTVCGLPLLGVLNAINIETWWISSQKIYNQFSSPLMLVSKHVKSLSEIYGDNIIYDEMLIPYIKSAIASNNKRKIIFVNLMGSHFLYSDRYPEKFRVYNDCSDIMCVKKSKSVCDIVNSYDNSILYTDYVLSEIINLIKNNDSSFLIYISDHGQDVYDTKDIASHSLEKIGYEIPLWIYFNKKYIEKNITKIEKWKKYTSRVGVSDSLANIIFECIGGVKYKKIDDSMNPLSELYDAEKIKLPKWRN